MHRLSFIDSSRGLAVVLAMLSHAFIQFAPEVEFSGWFVAMRSLVTRTATPTFLVLFGIMMELAYFRKSREGGHISIPRNRMFQRMLTCYLLYVAVTLAAVVTQKLTLAQGGLAISFQGTGRFVEILKLYVFMFLIVAITYPIGSRRGAVFYLGLAGAGWAGKLVLDMVGVEHKILLQFLLGYGDGGGPSVLPGLTLVGFGLLVGESITGRRSVLWPAAGLGLALMMLWYGVAEVGVKGLVWQLIFELRLLNHPYYYAFGIVVAMLSLGLFRWVNHSVGAQTDLSGQRLSFAGIGQDTLFYFGFGNIALNIVPVYAGKEIGVALLLVVTFMAALTMTACYQVPITRSLNWLSFGSVDRIKAALTWCNIQCTAWLLRLAATSDRIFFVQLIQNAQTGDSVTPEKVGAASFSPRRG